jgi:hypothetical protein
MGRGRDTGARHLSTLGQWIQTLVVAGLSSEHLEGLFLVPAELISKEEPRDEETKEVAGLDPK